MKSWLRLFLTSVVAACSLSASRAQSPASLFFLNIPDIFGESEQPGHKGEIDVFTFKLGVSQRGVSDFGAGGGAGKSQFHPLVIYKSVDLSSPSLFLACATGKPIPKVELKGTKNSEPYIKITMSDVLVSSYQLEPASESDETQTTLESVSLSFARIEITYLPRNPDGSSGTPVTVGFDVKTNKKL